LVRLLRRERAILHQKRNLLRAIFGDKAGDVKDASLKASILHLKGVVIDKKLFSRAVKTRQSKLADKAILRRRLTKSSMLR
jgi:DNA-directed RNA polymerase subunit beta